MARNNRENEQIKFPQNATTDGIDVEYSIELADQGDVEAQARAHAADQRAKRKK